MKNQIVEFLRTKDFKYIKQIGQGGTGKTVLLKDETIDEDFVCKKYLPYFKEHKDLFFKNFVDEIKILHKLYHRNVVRVFNYYLYPEQKTGYILMEYILGENIEIFIQENPHLINDIFLQTINGFRYLEENGILHRDIRPDNILINETGVVKIIDFGFGKNIKFNDNIEKSITLNWRYLQPNDFKDRFYDSRTDVYFIGKLFEEIITTNKLDGFSYSRILSEMIKIDYNERIQSFLDIERKLLADESSNLDFAEKEKSIYKSFANSLNSIFTSIESDSDYHSDMETIIKNLETVYLNSMLEEYIQNPNTIANCFVKGGYSYRPRTEFRVDTLNDFLKFFKSVSSGKKKIILNNLWQRIDSVERKDNQVLETDDLPF